jgi:hypothetical protein
MKRVSLMLWTVVAILLLLWAIGMMASQTFGGLLHALLILVVLAVVVDLVRTMHSWP